MECVNCRHTDLAEENGDYVCRNCGWVQPEQVIDFGKEWRDFDDDRETGESRSRVEEIDDEFTSLTTDFSAHNFGAMGVSQTAKTFSKFSRMGATETERQEAHLKEAFAKINEMSEQLQLPQIIRSTAKEIIKNFEKNRQKHMKGIKKEAFIAAVLLVASKHEMGGGRTLKSFSRSTNIDEREIKRFYKMLINDKTLIQIQPIGRQTYRKSTEEEVKDLIDVFCNKLQQPFSVSKQSKEAAVKAIPHLEGKRPSSIAAAAILFIFNYTRAPQKQQDLATIAGISTNTLRNVYKELSKHIDDVPLS